MPVMSDEQKLGQSAMVMRIVGWSIFILPVGLFLYPAGIVWGNLPPGFPIICGAHPTSPLDGLHPYLWMLFGTRGRRYPCSTSASSPTWSTA